MNRQLRTATALVLAASILFLGCAPTQPFFLHEDGDLNTYLDKIQDIEHPDVETAEIREATQAFEPLTVLNPDFDNWWDLSLEEAMAITLHNSKVIRNSGQVSQFGIADGLLNRTATAPTVFDPGIAASNTSNRPNVLSNPPGSAGAIGTTSRGIDPENFATAQTVGGVEDALATFDAQFSAVYGYEHSDVQNNSRITNAFTPPITVSSRAVFDSGITKRLATGGSAMIKHRIEHTHSNTGSRVSDGINSFPSLAGDYTATTQLRVDHPLLRGRGAFITRTSILLARINEDISVNDFQIAVRNQLLDLENAYWDLQCAYRNFETAKSGRDAAHRTWQKAYDLAKGGRQTVQAELQAREQFNFFRAQLESALGTLLETEARLRWLMGLSPTDGNLIRPIDDPIIADVHFSWDEIKTESLYRNAELRQQRWRIKQRELELANARHLLLPALNFFAMHQWSGTGDELITADRRGNNFHDPAGVVGSTAWDNMTEGDIQGSFIGLEFLPPAFGARREQARIRNAQLALKRENARFEDMELQSVHLLSTAVRNKTLNYRLIQSHLNRWAAADGELSSASAALNEGRAVLNNRATVDIVLDALRRRALAQSDYFTAVCEYNKALADVHFRKGSLLDYSGVAVAEGPWPDKAYWDALEKARQRDASYFLNYGYTRPGVISRGPVGGPISQGDSDVEIIETPAGQPVPATEGAAPMDIPSTDSDQESATILKTSVSQPFQWGNLGLDRSSAAPPAEPAPIEPAPLAPAPAFAAPAGENPLR